MSEIHRNSPAEAEDEKLGFVHENLEGWIPALAGEIELREALEKAFDYRGDLTITLKSGAKVEGYVFDRRIKGPSLAECFARVMPKDSSEKLSIAFSDVAALAFTGRDTAAGKSFAAWVKKYNEKKAAGEKDIGLEPESLD
jgi:hypothetical protein